MRRLLALAISVAFTACSYTPPKFHDRPPVIAVADHRPVPRPLPRLVLGPFDVADAYLRQGITHALDPADYNLALDVNALDEVVESSWWNPPRDPDRPLAGYRQAGPPEAPMVLEIGPSPSKRPGVVRVKDARGIRYTVIPDPRDRPGLHSSAGVVASRLLFAMGWRVPEAYAIRQENGEPALAMVWPMGVDLGPTPPFRARFDDANDTIARKDRRSLRALPRILAWLAKRDLDVGDLRDSYIGESPEGFVMHWVMGLEGALGVDALERQLALLDDPDRPAESSTERFLTLGLGAPADVGSPATGRPGFGLWSREVKLEDFDPSPPFEPLRYITSADEVWAGERMALLPRRVLDDAVRATPLSDEDRLEMLDRLDERRRAMASWCLDRGTPLDPTSVTLTPEGHLRVRLVDRAVVAGFVSNRNSSWGVTLYDAEGDPLPGVADTFRIDDGVEVVVRPGLIRGARYVAIRVRGSRGGVPLPRAMEVHVALGGGKPPRVVGVVH